jgi:hypothetical protein
VNINIRTENGITTVTVTDGQESVTITLQQSTGVEVTRATPAATKKG